MRLRRAVIGLGLGLGLGLGTAHAEAVAVTLRVNQQLANGATRPVAAGDTLHSGDRIEVQVEVEAPLYVYVVQAFADGSAAVLFPPADELKVEPGAPARLPPAGQWFELDRATGEENVIVIASAEPLDHADRAARKVVAELRRPRAKKSPPAAPIAMSLKTRGLVIVDDKPEHAVTVRTDAHGVALFRFAFHHR